MKIFIFMVGTIGIRIDEQKDLEAETPVYSEIRGNGRYYLTLNRENLTDSYIVNKLLSLNMLSKKLENASKNISPKSFLDLYFQD